MAAAATPSPASDSAAVYNYAVFDPAHYSYGGFRDRTPQVGDCAIDFVATTLDGAHVNLSDHAGQRIVLETGSITCPGYAAGVRSMNDLARAHPDVVFLVLYVREAHPGSNVGCHRTQSDKDQQASLVADLRREQRTILVDDVDGTAHRAYGSLPNSVFVIGTDGRVQWRCTWNQPSMVGRVLDAPDRSRPDLPWHAEPPASSPRHAIGVMRFAGWNTVGHFFSRIVRVVRQHIDAARLMREPQPDLPVSDEQPCWDSTA